MPSAAGHASPHVRSERSAARANNVLLACGLVWCTALIHVQAAIDHVDQYWLYALFFIVLAFAQFAWGVAIYRSPSRGMFVFGALGSLAVVGLWIVSRTSGLLLGPTPGVPEAFGVLDGIASANELALAALIALQLYSARSARLAQTARGLQIIALFLIVLSTLVLGGGFHAH